MIIKLQKVISCSSEHPSYPASNLLQYRSNSSWRTAAPGAMLAKVTFQLAEPSCITGIDIGNYRSCVVIVCASTAAEPDNWVQIVHHQFLTHDEAVNRQFKDQVQIFTKNELNPDAKTIQFDRIQVTCMQSANLKELFGLSFIVFKTEIKVDMGLDVFGRFKLKEENKEDNTMQMLREKYMKCRGATKRIDYKGELLSRIKQDGMNNFAKKQETEMEPMKRPLLEKLEAGKTDEVFGTKNKTLDNSQSKNNNTDDMQSFLPVIPNASEKAVKRTPFGDIIPSTPKAVKKDTEKQNNSKKRYLSPDDDKPGPSNVKKQHQCEQCHKKCNGKLCDDCSPGSKTQLPKKPERKRSLDVKKKRKPFSKLLEDVCFVLSGYQNPQRDQIRRKALEMGAQYIADVDKSNKKCTHLICAFKKTPKYQQLKGQCKIVSHTFIEECHKEKTRFPWRRYALDNKEKAEPESEEEILVELSPAQNPSSSTTVFEVDTDPDSDSNY